MEILQQQTSQMLEIIIGGLFSALLAFALVYAKKGFAYLKLKANSIQDSDAREIVQKTLDNLDNILVTNITSTDSTLKPIILKDVADGKVTKDELNSLADTVKNNTLKQLGNDSLNVLNESLGDVNGYISNRMEKLLADLKVDETSSVTKTIIPEIPQEVKDTEALKAQITELTSQLQQSQTDKDSLSQQLSELQEAKRLSEQSWQDLANQVSSLSTENQNLKAKLDSITQVVQPIVVTEPSVDSSNAIPTTDNQTVVQ
jgi:chromosome segregation ATPase